ncbi:hypothetical protein ACFW25_39180, partial [Streptomyces tendae]
LEQLPQLVRHQPLNDPLHDGQLTQPNEMTSKAYRELEREGLVEPRPGQGTFVRRTLARPSAGTDSPLYGELVAWVSRAAGAGLEQEDVAALVASAMQKQYATGTATTATTATTTRSTGE